MLYIKIVFIICFLILFFKNLYFILTIYQQEHYDNKKLLKSLPTFYLKKKYNYFLYLAFLIAIIDNIYLYILGMIFGIVSIFLKDKYIIKLKVTRRIKRLITMYSLIIFLILCFIPNTFHLESIFFLFIINPFYNSFKILTFAFF